MTVTRTSNNITRYLEAAKKATAGEWTWEKDPHTATVYAGRDNQHHGLNLFGRLEPDGNGSANLDFICAAANARDDIERQRYAAAVLYQCLGVLADDHPQRELLLDTLSWMKGSQDEAPDFEKLLPFEDRIRELVGERV